MLNFGNRIKEFLKKVFVRTEWTFYSVLYEIGIVILAILLLPFIIVALVFGGIIFLLFLPKYIQTKRMIKKQMKMMQNPNEPENDPQNKRATEVNVVDEQVDLKDKQDPQIAE